MWFWSGLKVSAIWISGFFVLVIFVGDNVFFLFFKIAYQIAREGFSGRLRETFLVLNDDEPRPVRQADEAGGAGPGGDLSRSQDLRRGQKHHMEVDDDATSPPSVAPKKQDQSRSNEKNHRNKGRNK